MKINKKDILLMILKELERWAKKLDFTKCILKIGEKTTRSYLSVSKERLCRHFS